MSGLQVIFTLIADTGHHGGFADPYFKDLAQEFKDIKLDQILNGGKGAIATIPEGRLDFFRDELAEECKITVKRSQSPPHP